MNKLFLTFTLLMLCSMYMPAQATHGTDRGVSGRSIGAAACSLLVWPGIGQAINQQSTDKNVTHALLGLTGVFRIWSFYDALVDRNGGVWHSRI